MMIAGTMGIVVLFIESKMPELLADLVMEKVPNVQWAAVAMALFANSSVGSVGGQALLISAFTVGINFICGFYPESTNMGICEMANLPYNIFLKVWLKILIPMLIVATAIISVAPYIGLV